MAGLVRYYVCIGPFQAGTILMGRFQTQAMPYMVEDSNDSTASAWYCEARRCFCQNQFCEHRPCGFDHLCMQLGTIIRHEARYADIE